MRNFLKMSTRRISTVYQFQVFKNAVQVKTDRLKTCMDLVKSDLTHHFLWLSFLFGIHISIKGKNSAKTTLETPYVKNLHVLCR